jgi:hypothetical protein
MTNLSSTTVDLPVAPITGSRVPTLTSLHSTPSRRPWGDSRYPGNCSGYLIKDLLMFYGAKTVFDPRTGSGTCHDVCEELQIDCRSFDVRSGFDASDTAAYDGLPTFDFIWLHPPYWRMKQYSDDPRCLSNCRSLNEFGDHLRQVINNCVGVLAPEGKLAILMGDFYDRQQRRHLPLAHLTKSVCLDAGLWPAAIDIIRFQHNNSSSRKIYRSAFIPGLHDVCMVFKRLNA